MIDTQQRLSRLTYSPHRRKQLFGGGEIPGLWFVSIITKLVNIGNQAVAAAKQSAAFRGVLATRVICDCGCDHRRYLNVVLVQLSAS
jgi:hypothetical protein